MEPINETQFLKLGLILAFLMAFSFVVLVTAAAIFDGCRCGWSIHYKAAPMMARLALSKKSISKQSARYRSMGNLLFWLGIGAAQKGAGSKPIKRRHWVASLIVGILVALLIAVGMFFLLVSQK
jgi:hypothetical protein